MVVSVVLVVDCAGAAESAGGEVLSRRARKAVDDRGVSSATDLDAIVSETISS